VKKPYLWHSPSNDITPLLRIIREWIKGFCNLLGGPFIPVLIDQKPVLWSLKKGRKKVLSKNKEVSPPFLPLPRLSYIGLVAFLVLVPLKTISLSCSYVCPGFSLIIWCFQLPCAVSLNRAHCDVTSVDIVSQKRTVLFLRLHISCSPLLFPSAVLNSSHTICGFDWPPFPQPHTIICTLTMLTLA